MDTGQQLEACITQMRVILSIMIHWKTPYKDWNIVTDQSAVSQITVIEHSYPQLETPFVKSWICPCKVIWNSIIIHWLKLSVYNPCLAYFVCIKIYSLCMIYLFAAAYRKPTRVHICLDSQTACWWWWWFPVQVADGTCFWGGSFTAALILLYGIQRW